MKLLQQTQKKPHPEGCGPKPYNQMFTDYAFTDAM